MAFILLWALFKHHGYRSHFKEAILVYGFWWILENVVHLLTIETGLKNNNPGWPCFLWISTAKSENDLRIWFDSTSLSETDIPQIRCEVCCFACQYSQKEPSTNLDWLLQKHMLMGEHRNHPHLQQSIMSLLFLKIRNMENINSINVYRKTTGVAFCAKDSENMTQFLFPGTQPPEGCSHANRDTGGVRTRRGHWTQCSCGDTGWWPRPRDWEGYIVLTGKRQPPQSNRLTCAGYCAVMEPRNVRGWWQRMKLKRQVKVMRQCGGFYFQLSVSQPWSHNLVWSMCTGRDRWACLIHGTYTEPHVFIIDTQN